MTKDELREWRLSLPREDPETPVSRAGAAKLLNGTPPNSYRDWEAGRRRIPAMLPLACYAVSAGLSESAKGAATK